MLEPQIKNKNLNDLNLMIIECTVQNF
jgi:hypothetical protein